jgi:hypothetical protein
MWVHLRLPVEPGLAPAWPVPVAADDDGDALGDAEDDAEAVDAVDVVAAVPALPVEASATPVTLAPTPAATTPVTISRRARPPTMETIGFLPSRRPPRRGWLVFGISLASRAHHAPETRLSGRYEPACIATPLSAKRNAGEALFT